MNFAQDTACLVSKVPNIMDGCLDQLALQQLLGTKNAERM